MDPETRLVLPPTSAGVRALRVAGGATLLVCAAQALVLVLLGGGAVVVALDSSDLAETLAMVGAMGMCWGLPAVLSMIVGFAQLLVARTLPETGITPLATTTLVAGVVVPLLRIPTSYLSLNCLDFFLQGLALTGGVIAAVLVFYDLAGQPVRTRPG